MLKRRMYVREIGLKVGHALWERDDLGSNPRSPIFCFCFLFLFEFFIFFFEIFIKYLFQIKFDNQNYKDFDS